LYDYSFLFTSIRVQFENAEEEGPQGEGFLGQGRNAIAHALLSCSLPRTLLLNTEEENCGVKICVYLCVSVDKFLMRSTWGMGNGEQGMGDGIENRGGNHGELMKSPLLCYNRTNGF
jgi:hypothetical protein